MFAAQSDGRKDDFKVDLDTNSTEDDYFEIMTNMNDDKDKVVNISQKGQV